MLKGLIFLRLVDKPFLRLERVPGSAIRFQPGRGRKAGLQKLASIPNIKNRHMGKRFQ
ncbi:hypothetical protein TRIP_B200420 [uncultured Desulfatiglans sp.]|uniref:Uncharacterized protein n=1 Tax=Uncultured Desulfatiglans sp. TaxID=1748965 RepID=A0A653A2N3_UNCDX|nr:hypothetical protein TRIP_B200420 [uncultured Desulfatiglans sp.]